MAFFEIVPPNTNYDFIGKWKLCVGFSIFFAIATVVGFFGEGGLKLGIDFAGGTEIQLRFPENSSAEEGAIRKAVSASGVKDPTVVRYGGAHSNQFLIRFRGKAEQENVKRVEGIKARIQKEIGPVVVDSVSYVGPRVGAELREDGINALLISWVLVLIYITFRFSARFAPGAIIALIHDVVLTSGVFIICGLEFDLTVLAALLAIVGYSLNDTIIVYDRIRENLETHSKKDLPAVVNLSVNQTLSRTLLTSGTTLLAVLSLLFVGGKVIRPFALAMTIGVFVGTYSSIYIASPILIGLENWLGNRKLRGAERARGKGSTPKKAGAKQEVAPVANPSQKHGGKKGKKNKKAKRR